MGASTEAAAVPFATDDRQSDWGGRSGQQGAHRDPRLSS